MHTFTHIVVHIGEVILKGANRRSFEKRLVADITEKFAAHDMHIEIYHGYGRLIITSSVLSEHFQEQLLSTLQHIPGITNIAFALNAEADITHIKQRATELIAEDTFSSFKIDTRRADKSFPLSSQEMNEQLGAHVQKETGAAVDLSSPERTIYVEITDHGVFIYTHKYPGMGGLPVGTSGHGFALFSGGIDSPTAASLMMKRGMRISALHFHSVPRISPQSIEKVRTLLHTLNNIQPEISLHLVPLLPIQKQIAAHCPESLWIILQRRFMMRIAEKLAVRENGDALITGESLGQVASQTIQNMHVIGSVAANEPILRPLVGWDKQEIIAYAQHIGTYETSILPHEDCCTAFMPDAPETKAYMPAIENAEQKLNIDALVDDALAQMETETISLHP